MQRRENLEPINWESSQMLFSEKNATSNTPPPSQPPKTSSAHIQYIIFLTICIEIQESIFKNI